MPMNRILLGLTAVVLFGCAPERKAATSPFELVRDGRCVARIVTAKGAEAAAKFFADEAEKCVGSRFEVVEAAPADGNRVVFVVTPCALDREDEYAITFPDDRTMKIACSPVSARWAVNEILRSAFGVRWLFPFPEKDFGEDLNEYPRATSVAVPRKGIRRKPFDYWSLRSFDWRIDGWNAHWDCKGTRGVHGICVDAFPALKYAADQSWPKEMLPVLGGKKFLPVKAKTPMPKDPYKARKPYKSRWNPCFSHPKSAEIAIANILEAIAADPSKKMINLDLNDNGGMCECADCLKAVGGRLNSIGMTDRSETYYKWVNRVAEGVTAVHPDVCFSLIAYREVIDPPTFRLHPNVLPRVCFEVAAMVDPEIRARRMRMMEAWAKVCPHVELYDYSYGINWFFLPRYYGKAHVGFLRELHARGNACGYYSEAVATPPFDGPKYYLYGEALKDCAVDADRVVADWCRTAVGEKAAPALVAYYRFWEDYWCGEEIRRTEWFSHSKGQTYLPGGRTSSMFALKPGDMARCRKLMEEVVAKADTPMRRKRAEALRALFELAELSAEAVFAETMPTSGKLRSAQEAVALLRAVKPACAALAKMEKNRFIKSLGSFGLLAGEQRKALAAVVPFADDPAVRDELRKQAADAELPSVLRGMFRIWAGEKAVNLIANGSFEAERPLPCGWQKGNLIGRRTDMEASDGRFSLAARELMSEFRFTPEAGRTYLVMYDVKCSASSAEGKFNCRITPCGKGVARTHIGSYDISLAGGEWQTLSGVVTTGAGAKSGIPDDEVVIDLYGKKYEPDETVWLDNVRVYRID